MRIPIESSTSYRGRNSRPNWLALLAFVGSGAVAGGVGAIFSPVLSGAGAVWYTALAKPSWTPADRWFGPIWTLLYLSMGIAAWIVWSERYHRGRSGALLAFAVQLLLSALWSPLFFGLRNVGLGLMVSVALWLSLIWTLREFAGVRAAAAAFVVPCLTWSSFALALNLAIWRHNP